MRIGAKSAALILGLTAAYAPAHADVPLDGFFIARDACPALQSIRKATNPGDVKLDPGRAYDILAANREQPSHYLVRVPNASPDRRWVGLGCGVRTVLADSQPQQPTPGPGSGPSPQPGPQPGPQSIEYILAVSWQPAFCETRPGKRECESQTADRPDATHLSLHGLWPQPRSNVYCQVSAEDAALDKAGRWAELPDLMLPSPLKTELDVAMPGTQSFLERHEWTKHGTCYGDTVDEYYADSLFLMTALNASPVRDVFADAIGQEITSDAIRDAFDEAFGPGAGSRVRVSCSDDPDSGRRMIGELTIALSGPIEADSKVGDLIFAAAPTDNAGCPKGLVDAAGLQ